MNDIILTDYEESDYELVLDNLEENDYYQVDEEF